MRFRRRPREPVLPEATNATVTPSGTAIAALAQAYYASIGGSAVGLEGLGVVDRCLQLNAQGIASMPLRYRHAADVAGVNGGNGPAWISDPDPAWYPNGIGDAIFSAVWSIYAKGEAFLWATTRYEDGYPRTWSVLDAATMHVEEQGGERAYRSNGYDLRPGSVVHIRRNPTGALRGTSALASWATSIESLYQAEMFAADVYASTGVNRVALKSSRRLDSEQAEQLQADWVAAVSRRLGAPAILPPDLDLLETLSISPKDLMLLESREWDTRQLCAALGVPAILLNVPVVGGLTYQNPAMLTELWWRTELFPTAVKIGRALSRWLPRGHWVEFDPGAALKPDLEAATRIAAQALDAGLLTPAEARAWVFDLPPLPEGEQEEELFEEEGAHGSSGSSPTPAEVIIA